MFLCWLDERNKRTDVESIRPNKRTDVESIQPSILSCDDANRVSYVLRLFVLEVRKGNGEKYPPATIRSLRSGLHREMGKNRVPFSFMDGGDLRFRELHLTLDSVSSELHREGIGVGRKSAVIVSIEDEDQFWSSGALGTAFPEVLQRTVFFYVGMQFVLRGVQEQHDLLVRQFIRHPPCRSTYSSDVYYEYS